MTTSRWAEISYYERDVCELHEVVVIVHCWVQPWAASTLTVAARQHVNWPPVVPAGKSEEARDCTAVRRPYGRSCRSPVVGWDGSGPLSL
jgi:hypothetical protein